MFQAQRNTNTLLDISSLQGGIVRPVEFSFFKCPVKNTHPSRNMTLWEVYQLVKSYSYQPQTALLRSISDTLYAKEYKASHFDYVTFSGTFTSRKNEGLIQHSGLMSIDFDHVDDVKQLKATLLEDKHFETELAFFSPSEDGFKWVVSVDLETYSHRDWFFAIEHYIHHTYGLKIDSNCKDVSRACFLPYDPGVYLHPNYFNSTYSKTTYSYQHENN